MKHIRNSRGSTSVEYLLIAVVAIGSLAISVKGAQVYCLHKQDTDVRACETVEGMVQQAFENSVTDITTLINLPF